MKIQPLQNYIYAKPYTPKQVNITTPKFEAKNYPIQPANNYYLINFGSGYTNFQDNLLSLDGVHCPCCGEEMLSAQKASEIIRSVRKAQDLQQYSKVLSENKEYFHHKFHPFIKSLNYLAQNYPEKSIEDALKILYTGSSKLVVKTMHSQAQYLNKLYEDYNFSTSDKEKLKSCADYLATREVLPKKDEYDKILDQTLRQLDNEKKKDITFKVNNRIMSAYNCRNILSLINKQDSKIPKHEYIIKTMLSYSQNSLVNIFEPKPSYLKYNDMLICTKCSKRYKSFNYIKNSPHAEENLKFYVDDISNAIANNRLGKNDQYLYDFIKIANSNKSSNVLIRKTDLNGIVQSRLFSQRKRGYVFEQYSGIPCGSCGTKTITHNEKLAIFNDIKQCENLHELYGTIKINKEHIIPNYKLIFNRFEKLLKENPNISETEMLNQLQIANRKDFVKHLNYICEKIESTANKSQYNFVEKEIIKDFIFTLKNDFMTTPPQKEFRYDDYNTAIEKTLSKLHHQDKAKLICIAKEDLKKYYMLDYIVHPPENIIATAGNEIKAMFQNIFKMSVITVDHMDALALGGADEYYNKIGLCKGCNNEKGRQPLKQWAKQHPEINRNLPKHLKFVSSIIKKENLKDMIDYPEEAAKQANKLGQGKIHIQTDYGLKD